MRRDWVLSSGRVKWGSLPVHGSDGSIGPWNRQKETSHRSWPLGRHHAAHCAASHRHCVQKYHTSPLPQRRCAPARRHFSRAQRRCAAPHSLYRHPSDFIDVLAIPCPVFVNRCVSKQDGRGAEVQSSKFKVQSSKFKVQSSKFKVQSSKFKAESRRDGIFVATAERESPQLRRSGIGPHMPPLRGLVDSSGAFLQLFRSYGAAASSRLNFEL